MKFRNWCWRIGWSILTVALVAGAMAWLIWLPPNGENVNRVSTDQYLIALTFDDGPNVPHTGGILAVLEKHAAKATFFMTGEHIAAYPDLVRRVIAAGHQIGNHGVDGKVLAFRDRAFIRAQIAEVDAAIRALGYQGEIPFRAPRGMQFLNVASVLRAQDRAHIGASGIGRDWVENSSAEKIANRLIKAAQPGAIFSLHDGDDASETADRSASVAALEIVLKSLGDQYRFVTIDELRRQ